MLILIDQPSFDLAQMFLHNNYHNVNDRQCLHASVLVISQLIEKIMNLFGFF